MFNENENYLHYFAKNTLYLWLQGMEKRFDQPEWNGLKWTRGAGIHMELPFYNNSHPIYFENRRELHKYQEFTPDIVIFDGNKAKYLLEIVNYSPVTDVKLSKIAEFFKDSPIELYEFSALDVLQNKHGAIPLTLRKRRLL